MSILIARKKAKDARALPLFDYRRLLISHKLCMRPTFVSHFPEQKIAIHPIDYFELSKRLRPTGIYRRISLDDSKSRIAIWRALFKDEPLPRIEEDAVEKYAGSLDKYLPENVPVDEVVRRAKTG